MADCFCPNTQTNTMGIIGLSQNGSGNSQENLEGVFYSLLYKRGYNKKIGQFAGDYVWPSFVKVSNDGESCIIEGPRGDSTVWFLLPLPGSFCSAFRTFSLPHPGFVQFWYADRLTLKKGFPWRREGPVDVARDKANTNVARFVQRWKPIPE